jgi:hypothetical protein
LRLAFGDSVQSRRFFPFRRLFGRMMHQVMCFAIEATAPEFVAGQHTFRTELFNQLFYKFSSDTRRMACYFQSLKIGITDDDNIMLVFNFSK